MKSFVGLLLVAASFGYVHGAPSLSWAESEDHDDGHEEDRQLTPAEQKQEWRNQIREKSLHAVQLSLHLACLPLELLEQGEEPSVITEKQAEAIEACAERRGRNITAQLAQFNRALGVTSLSPLLVRQAVRSFISDYSATEGDEPTDLPDDQ